MRIPFTKAHGARNDFLLTWIEDAPSADLTAAAIAICGRHTGVGADGWLLVTLGPRRGAHDAAIRLFNSDGSEVELSGNGTRCAAAFLIDGGLEKSELRILTGAGVKHLRLLERAGRRFQFEMNMGCPHVAEGDLHYLLQLADGPHDVSILDVGNPQCAVFAGDLSLNWRRIGAEIERHTHFSRKTNVSFVRAMDEHSIEVRFWERGAGETQSSGTGSTGAAAAAVLRGLVKSPVRVVTPAGDLNLRWNSPSEDVFLVGPAEITASGKYYFEG